MTQLFQDAQPLLASKLLREKDLNHHNWNRFEQSWFEQRTHTMPILGRETQSTMPKLLNHQGAPKLEPQSLADSAWKLHFPY